MSQQIISVLFDLDGVLVDAREWHYEALNRALGLLANVAVIVVAALVTYAAIGMKGSALRVFEKVSDLPKSKGEA